jgi:hypothetical protein
MVVLDTVMEKANVRDLVCAPNVLEPCGKEVDMFLIAGSVVRKVLVAEISIVQQVRRALSSPWMQVL